MTSGLAYLDLPGEDRSFGGELVVDLIPRGSWFRNVRAVLSQSEWGRLRRSIYDRANSTCELCGARNTRLDCHERFAYGAAAPGTPSTQTLVRLLALCVPCHGASHFGLAAVSGRAESAFDHLKRVRKWTEARTSAHVDAAFAEWEARSRREWVVDLSLIERAGFALKSPPPLF